MNTKHEPELVDITGWLRLCYEDAGIPYPEGETLKIPLKMWKRWKKRLHLLEPADYEHVEEVSNDRTRDSENQQS